MTGRADETALVLALAAAAAGGESGTLLVAGEAGVGKTSLLRDACDGIQARILWLPCLPLTSLAAPLLALHTALRDVSDAPPLNTASAVLEFDAWLDRQARQQPTVLVVDDVQWADQSSLDLLMYVIAGRADRRLAVFVTLRTGDEHRLHRWLADIRRLPRVREMELGRLDRVATRDQIAALLGSPPHESLVDDVHGRSTGNPYLTSLLVRGLASDARALPAHLPTELRGALARTWHGLSAPARKLTSEIAVAGRPQEVSGLDAVPLLREAIDAGVLRIDADERYWFAHPLLAEVLLETLLPGERRARHGELAETATDPIDRADHYYQAGLVEPAYRWALRAAEAAEGSGGAAEAVRLLRRALRLRTSSELGWLFRRGRQSADTEVSAVDLLHRIRRAAQRSGRGADELAAIDELLARVDRDAQPLVAAELLARRTQLRFGLGIEFAGLADAREAERFSAGHPDSREHALATAQLASHLLWHGDESGAARAEKAIRLARAGGWPSAIGPALIAVSMARTMIGDLAGGSAAAHEAYAIGVQSRDYDLAVTATYWVANTADRPSPRSFIEDVRRCREQLERVGAPHGHISEICSVEAEGLLLVGDWRGCLGRLRVTLGARPSTLADARARNTAALLASRQGRYAEAVAHAAWAEELILGCSQFLPFPFDAVRAEIAVAAGDPEHAITSALRGLSLNPPPLESEVLLPLAARALADLAEASRDRGTDPAPELARLRELREHYPVVRESAGKAEHERLRIRAMQDLADAETARGLRAEDETGRWHRAAESCREAEVLWDEAYCRRREAQAALRDRSTRRQATAALRRAYEIAIDLEAGPLLAELAVLAKNAHVATVAVVNPAAPADGVPGLTGREREILPHLVAGRTYGEIARALVLSEKTVSAHVSNMLRKTGTASRVELAQLAHRFRALR